MKLMIRQEIVPSKALNRTVGKIVVSRADKSKELAAGEFFKAKLLRCVFVEWGVAAGTTAARARGAGGVGGRAAPSR